MRHLISMSEVNRRQPMCGILMTKRDGYSLRLEDIDCPKCSKLLDSVSDEVMNRLKEANGTAPPAMPTPDERVQACLSEINAACERWACRLQTVFTVVDNMPNSSINVVVK